MSLIDSLTDTDLEHLCCTMHKLARAVTGAGMDATRLLTPDELTACSKLAGCCPIGPIEVNGDLDEAG